MERDYYTVPFKPRFISQSLCKCDRSLPLQSIRKNPRILNASFSFCNRSQGYFLLFLDLRDKRKVAQRNLYGSLEIRVSRKLFPKCKSMIRARFCLQHRESVNMKTLTNQNMISDSGYYRTAASKACLRAPPPFPPPQSTAWYLRIFSIGFGNMFENLNWWLSF